jgi:hypothetical protein
LLNSVRDHNVDSKALFSRPLLCLIRRAATFRKPRGISQQRRRKIISDD